MFLFSQRHMLVMSYAGDIILLLLKILAQENKVPARFKSHSQENLTCAKIVPFA